MSVCGKPSRNWCGCTKISILGHLHKPVNPTDLSALLEKWTPPSLCESWAAKKAYNADEVRAAIINGELVNYYQPKVEVVSGKVVGVESLVRWRHPKTGWYFPTSLSVWRKSMG